MIKVIEKKYKSIIRIRKYIDPDFWEKYSLNPYEGCTYSCNYCYSRNFKYHEPEDFGKQIIVKKDIDKLLKKRIENTKTLIPDIVGISGRVDPYQSIEHKYKSTQKCLMILLKHQFPVHIVTKSDLVLRDLDILKHLSDNWCHVSISLTTINEQKSKKLEPNTISVKDRLKIIEHIKKNAPNIKIGILLMPFIPELSDNDDELEFLYKKAKDIGADYIIFNLLNLEPGYAEWFLNSLFKSYPEYTKIYEKLYKFIYRKEYYTGSYMPDADYKRKIYNKLIQLSKKYEIAYRIKRYIPNDYRKYNYILSQRLLDSSYLNMVENKEWKSLFWAGMNIQNLGESVSDILKRNELRNIKQIDSEIDDIVEQILRKEIL